MTIADGSAAGPLQMAIRDAEGVIAAAQLACLLEASAPKPGNVAPGRHFADTRFEHFLASAAAIGMPLRGADERPLGVTIRRAVEATTRWSPANTNLGIVLLLAPIARAAMIEVGQTERARPLDSGDAALEGLREAVAAILRTTTVDDAREVYAAIRLARPGGLGTAAAEDVRDEPTVTLTEAMRLASDRDSIAREYVTSFASTFERGLPVLAAARRDGLSWDDAVVEVFLSLLAAAPDTHVMRRGGADLARDISRRASEVRDAGGVRTAAGRRAIAELDASLRDPRNMANPGATADLTAATIFVFLLAGGWQLP